MLLLLFAQVRTLNWMPCLASVRSFPTLSFSMISRGYLFPYLLFSVFWVSFSGWTWKFTFYSNAMLVHCLARNCENDIEITNNWCSFA